MADGADPENNIIYAHSYLQARAVAALRHKGAVAASACTERRCWRRSLCYGRPSDTHDGFLPLLPGHGAGGGRTRGSCVAAVVSGLARLRPARARLLRAGSVIRLCPSPCRGSGLKAATALAFSLRRRGLRAGPADDGPLPAGAGGGGVRALPVPAGQRLRAGSPSTGRWPSCRSCCSWVSGLITAPGPGRGWPLPCLGGPHLHP